jgi:hypothetical protein
MGAHNESFSPAITSSTAPRAPTDRQHQASRSRSVDRNRQKNNKRSQGREGKQSPRGGASKTPHGWYSIDEQRCLPANLFSFFLRAILLANRWFFFGCLVLAGCAQGTARHPPTSLSPCRQLPLRGTQVAFATLACREKLEGIKCCLPLTGQSLNSQRWVAGPLLWSPMLLSQRHRFALGQWWEKKEKKKKKKGRLARGLPPRRQP